MDKDQLIHEIGSKAVADMGARRKGWAHLVLVGRVERDEPEMTGFAYTEDGNYTPVAPMDFKILDLLLELKNSMATTDNRPPWRACLIQIDRETGNIGFEFEYDKPDRWDITLNNSKDRARELSPVKK